MAPSLAPFYPEPLRVTVYLFCSVIYLTCAAVLYLIQVIIWILSPDFYYIMDTT